MQNKEDMQAFVTDMLQRQIPDAYSYHNYAHTLYVQDKARQGALREGLNEQERRLLDAAALWHDTGYTNTYKGHEEASCVLAKKHLGDFGFTPAEIDRICEMIMATKIPQSPVDLAGRILADADLAYLGTADAEEDAALLFEEMRSVNPALTENQWLQQQVQFLEQHRFFTPYYQENMEPVKQEYLAQLKKKARQ